MKDRIFDRPVAWLLGKQLIGGLKGILLYTAYGTKLDPRDWMTGEVVNFATRTAEQKGEFWFDYLSDAGDGNKAMYSLAYLAMSPLWTRLNEASISLPSNPADLPVSTTNTDNAYTFQLPRGEFLFFGGDTAYHAAEYMTLVNRIQRPFNYAYEDLRTYNLISDDEPRRPVFGIPGNHDYYDQVDGFRRQFRKPTRPEGPPPPKRPSGHNAQLTLAGFKRVQEASYVALRLPFDWWFWGLDSESPTEREKLNLDRRQEHFFRKVASSETGKFKEPDRLILATCSPSTVFGKVADPVGLKVARAMKAVKIATPFLPAKRQTDIATSGDAQLREGQCRLDLSGDVHHYARYWGPSSSQSPREHNSAPQLSAQSYASIVSGSGGAFHHPTTTFDDEICEQVLYPPEQVSRSAIADTLFKFWNVFLGGYVWVAGFILAFTIFFCLSAPVSSRQFVSNLPLLNKLDVTGTKTPQPVRPTVLATHSQVCGSVRPFWLWTSLGIVGDSWQPPQNCSPENPIYFFPDTKTWTTDLIIGQAFIWVSFAVIITTFCLSLFTKKIFNSDSPYEKGSNPDRILWPIVIVTVLLVMLGLFSIKPYRDHITPFASSLLVLYSIFAAITAIVLNFRYSDFLFRRSFVQPAKKGLLGWSIAKLDEILTGILWVTAIIIVGTGLWFFGKNNLPAYLVTDIVFILVLVFAVIGIMLLPFKVAGKLFYTRSKRVRIVGKSLIGIWHLVLQLLVPYILILNGNYFLWALALLLIFLPIPLAQTLLKRNNKLGLSILWILYGSVMLTLPWTTKWLLTRLHLEYLLVFPLVEGWRVLPPAVIAGIIGAVVCCLWTGWYFAICFAFNGHNNEVGGTARIEDFKEFIRFRVTRDGLTGYVIAVDDVGLINTDDGTGRRRDGNDLKPKLIDVFHLVPKK
ncbi:MAG TPA: hypothetical protein VI306_10410 [Pyrinomonadaceae bacterium]